MGRLFGQQPVGVISLVDAPLSTAYARRARTTVLVASPLAVLVSGAVLSAAHAGLPSLLLAVPLGVLAALALGALVRVWPVARVLWWWSVEIVAAFGVAVPLTWLAHATSAWVSLVLAALVAGVVGGVSRLRRRVVAWSWCVIVRHRLRLCFSQVVRATGRPPAGSLPLILWARPTPAGERVWVWLRPGLDLAALDGKGGQIAVACWASEVRVVRASARFAALIRVDLSRRDPLAGDLVSPLAALFADMPGPTAPAESGHAEAWALDLEDVAAPEPVESPRGRR